jgi:hypothetical protein
LLEGNKNLLAEHNALRDCSADLESELAEAHSGALEAWVRSTEAHTVDVAGAGERRLADQGLVRYVRVV